MSIKLSPQRESQMPLTFGRIYAHCTYVHTKAAQWKASEDSSCQNGSEKQPSVMQKSRIDTVHPTSTTKKKSIKDIFDILLSI